jgi:hypothetical protein
MEPLARAPQHILHPFPLSPPSIHRVKHQLTVSCFIPINAGHSSTLITGYRPPLSPYRKREPRCPPPHISQLSFSSLRARARPTPSASSAISSPPLPGRHTTTRAPVRPEMYSPCTPLPVAPPPAGHRAPERPLGRAPSSFVAGHGDRPTTDQRCSGP